MPRGTGSPGFSGSRLKEAREARQVTSLALAEIVGITRASISAYERGCHNPSPEVLERISTGLGFKTEFFLRADEPTVHQTVFERARSSATQAVRKRARHRRTWLRETIQYLTEFVSIPDPNLPDFGVSTNWQSISRPQIEAFARDARRYWNMGDGPISDVTLLAENNGVIICLIPMNANNLDAFSLWDEQDNRPYVVLGNDSQSAFRTRFNVCHELGHLILHKNLSVLDMDDSASLKVLEKQADQFSASFLTPSGAFSNDVVVPTLDQFRMLKARWRTSIKMMIHRSEELEMIDSADARRLYINYNRREWNIQEPLDQETKVEEPRLVKKIFEVIVDNSILRPSQIAAALPFNAEDIELLSNLPYGYLDEDSAYSWAVRELNSGFQTGHGKG